MSLSLMIEQGVRSSWLMMPTALVLGALHGLEPGHSKTVMAAFIIAIRGTVMQAILLGLSAAISHTAVVWLVALGGQYLGQNYRPESIEPYFQLASGIIVAGVAIWMIWRTWRDLRTAHDHDHHDHHEHDHEHEHDDAHMDDHERAHAADIERRFAGRPATTSQIVLFGLTGGLIPCPAAITVLLLCLQLKQLSLGALLVLCFSIGLAVTMVSVGVAASLAVKHAKARWSGFDGIARRAPYASGALMLALAAYMVLTGLAGLAHG